MDLAHMPSDWPMRAASRQISVAPHRWHVQISGAGPDLLLLHGAGGATHSWRHLVPLLTPRYRTIALDLPGQGFSRSGARSRSGLDPMAEDIARLCAAEGWAPAAIVGHSAGAVVALRLAEILPRTPAAVVGINAALASFEGVSGWFFSATAKVLAAMPFAARIFAAASGSEARVRALLASTGSELDDTGVRYYRTLVRDPGHVDGTLAMMAQWALDPFIARLPGFSVPTLLIASDQDRAVPYETSVQAARRMPTAHVDVIPGKGHLVHEEAAEAVAALMLPYLAERIQT